MHRIVVQSGATQKTLELIWYAVLELERGRLVRSEGIELQDGERVKEVDREGYKYLGVLQLDKVHEQGNEGKALQMSRSGE